jgi:carbamate kinase
MRIVDALGGNALLERGEAPDATVQTTHVTLAAQALAPLVRDHEVIITHGNGPQVGVLALESADDLVLNRPYPFDALVAETQGLIGHWLLDALGRAAPEAKTVCMVTRTMVDVLDPAFAVPTKFVGQGYTEADAKAQAAARGWHVAPDGDTWRRAVCSPEPKVIVEIDAVRELVDAGFTVICAGGGGVPVAVDGAGVLIGAEAVVDKDLTAALLAEQLGADVLLLLTDVPSVQAHYGTPAARVLHGATVTELRALDFAQGSMGPKVEAACRFVERCGGRAAIGQLSEAELLFAGVVGTQIPG